LLVPKKTETAAAPEVGNIVGAPGVGTEAMRRMPGLALPFAVVGAAAGWLSVAFLSNPIVALTRPDKRLAGVVVSALVAALVGLYLQKRCAPAPEGRRPRGRDGVARRGGRRR
jgi:hypothetical protein